MNLFATLFALLFVAACSSGERQPVAESQLESSANNLLNGSQSTASDGGNTSTGNESEQIPNTNVPGVNTDSGTTGGVAVPRFTEPQLIYSGEATTVQWGDIDGDGDDDLFVAEGGKHQGGTPTLSWIEFPGWIKHEVGTPLTPFTGDSQLVDMDFDNDLDIVISVDSHSDENDTGAIYWYENEIPQFSNWTQHVIEENIPNAFHIGDLAVGDVDANGLTDVVVRHLSTYRFVIYFQVGVNRWQAKRINTKNREGLAIADLNSDGLLDIIGNGYVLFAPSSPKTEIWQETIIDPAFYSQPKFFLNNSVKVGTADINNDGKLDVVISPAEGESVYFAWYETPDQPMSDYWEKHIIETPLANNHQVQIADVDLDGDLDLLGGFSFGEQGVVWWNNVDGKGDTFERQTIHTTNGCYSCRAADFDRDGDWDFAGPTKYVGKVYLYENQSANYAGAFLEQLVKPEPIIYDDGFQI